jgi:hypothetical protein
MKYILSYGGGLNSTALLVFLVKRKYPLDMVIFANTGDEFQHTYDSIKYYSDFCNKNGIEFVIVDEFKKYNVKSMIEYYIRKKSTPSRMRRDCTTKFKILPIRKYLRNTYGKKERFKMYIGIDYGELHRMKSSDVRYIEQVYPLVDAKIDRSGCKSYLIENNRPIPEKSGCYYCPYTKKDGWINLKMNHPKLFKKAMELEQNNKRYPEPVSLLSSKPLVKLTGNTTLEEFIPSCDVSAGCFL